MVVTLYINDTVNSILEKDLYYSDTRGNRLCIEIPFKHSRLKRHIKIQGDYGMTKKTKTETTNIQTRER